MSRNRSVIVSLLSRRRLWIVCLGLASVSVAYGWLCGTPDGKVVAEQIIGETPPDRVAAYLAAVSRGDEANAFEAWQLPASLDKERVHELDDRRELVTNSLMAAGVRRQFEVMRVEWWRTCCEPGTTDDARGAGGARVHVELFDRSGAPMAYVVDVFVRDLPYWGGALGYPLRHWVIRDVYREGDKPLFWNFGSSVLTPGSAFRQAYLRSDLPLALPNNSLEPTRRAAVYPIVRCVGSCARLRLALPNPPSGSARIR